MGLLGKAGLVVVGGACTMLWLYSGQFGGKQVVNCFYNRHYTKLEQVANLTQGKPDLSDKLGEGFDDSAKRLEEGIDKTARKLEDVYKNW